MFGNMFITRFYRRFLTVFAIFAMLVPAMVSTASAENNGNGEGHTGIPICHATGAEGHWVLQTPDAESIVKQGHHTHQDGRDIIPAFTYNGVDYPAQGDQSILENGCVVPAEQPVETPTTEPEETPDVTPEETPVVTPEETPIPEDNKVTICHATGSESNPYVVESPNASGVVHAHIEHQHGEDIIPAFSYNGTDYAAQGDQSILANGCKIVDPGKTPVVEPTQEPGVTPTVEPTQAPGETPTVEPSKAPAEPTDPADPSDPADPADPAPTKAVAALPSTGQGSQASSASMWFGASLAAVALAVVGGFVTRQRRS